MSSLNRRSARRSRLWAVLGLLLVPLTIAGVLTWALGSPGERLGDVKAAIVNNDEPVEVDGQLVPLGRQLSAKLVGDEIESNYTWEFATPETAEEGLENGTYAAVVTIPENFSAAATSFSGDPSEAERATIDVQTSERSRFADVAISRMVTATATDLLSEQLTTTYLDNIYVGFNTMGDKLGEAAEGAVSLADGAKELAGGTRQLADGAGELANGAQELANGLGALDDGAGQLAEGTSGLADGLAQMKEQTAQLPQQTATLADVSTQQAEGVQQLSTALDGMAQELQAMSEQCPPGVVEMCNKLMVQAMTAQELSKGAGQLVQASEGVSTGLDALAGRTPESGGGLPALAGGISQLADGAAQLDDGASQLADGVSQTHDGATQLASGAQELASGMRQAADGAAQLGDGSGQLSSGLEQATGQLPNYSEQDRDKLAKTVANPVVTAESTPLGFGATGPVLYAVLALWAGAMATFLALRAVPKQALESTKSTLRLLLSHLRLPAVVAVVQGLVVTTVFGLSQELDPEQWLSCAGLLVLTALAFTAVNQALAALGGVGRFAAMLVGLVVLATGFIAAVPSLLEEVAAVLPVGPVQDALRAVALGEAPSGGAIAALLVWAVCGLAVSYLAVERARTVKADRLRGALRGSPGVA